MKAVYHEIIYTLDLEWINLEIVYQQLIQGSKKKLA